MVWTVRSCAYGRSFFSLAARSWLPLWSYDPILENATDSATVVQLYHEGAFVYTREVTRVSVLVAPPPEETAAGAEQPPP